jgi:hypothetical protein
MPWPSSFCSKPIEGCSIHPKGSGDVHDRVTSVQPFDCLAPLMRRKLKRPPKPDAARLSPLPALACPSFDERPFEFGETAEDGQHQHPVRRGGIAPGILERAEAGPGLFYRL